MKGTEFMRVLTVVDMQNDFITGTLGNKECQAVVGNVVNVINTGNYDKIIATRDTHFEGYLNTITSPYSMRLHPIIKVYRLHTGMDIGAPMGSYAIAANDGIVTKATYSYSYGNMVMIDHGGGVSTLYAHGSEILVSVGDTVKRGDPILKVGSTGWSTGPHLHFEIIINGNTIDPYPFVTREVLETNEEQ